MTRLALALISLALLVPTLAGAAPRVDVRALTRIATKLTGLEARRAPQVFVVGGAALDRRAVAAFDARYTPAQQAYDQELYRALGLLRANEPLRPILLARHARNVAQLYDPASGRGYARSGRAASRNALTAIVHVLQDQSFDLKRVASASRDGRDSGTAASAATVAHATFATQVLGRTLAARAPASHTASHAKLFVELEASFAATTAVRMMSTLHNLGGRRAVKDALRRFPATTEQVFHIDKFLAGEPPRPIVLPGNAAGFQLARHDTWGELDIRALLAVFQVPRLDHVGEGWGGGLSAIYNSPGGRATVLRLDWDSERDAAEWADAVATYVNEAFHADEPGPPQTATCAAAVCWTPGGAAVGFDRRGARTSLVIAATAPAAGALANALVVPG
jgi:hypothetical protein